MAHKIIHTANLVALRRVEGQVKGIQKMIEEGKYCVDIVNQIHASVNALYRVAEKILTKHMENCVVDALRGRSKSQKKQKINEIMNIIKQLNKL